jgi:hypothetical protein
VITIVDTMGGLNLRMGNYEHTPEDRMWAAVEITGERSWVHGINADFPGRAPTEGEKDKWAQRKAIEYMSANPGTTIRRSFIKFADFWGLEREYAAGIAEGFYAPPRWLGVAASIAIVICFAAVAVSGVAGVWLASSHSWRANIALLLPALAIMAAHTIAFGHSRYHVPMIPILALYAASLWSTGWSASPAQLTQHRFVFVGAAASVLVLALIWGRQLLVVDAGRIQRFLAHVG